LPARTPPNPPTQLTTVAAQVPPRVLDFKRRRGGLNPSDRRFRSCPRVTAVGTGSFGSHQTPRVAAVRSRTASSRERSERRVFSHSISAAGIRSGCEPETFHPISLPILGSPTGCRCRPSPPRSSSGPSREARRTRRRKHRSEPEISTAHDAFVLRQIGLAHRNRPDDLAATRRPHPGRVHRLTLNDTGPRGTIRRAGFNQGRRSADKSSGYRPCEGRICWMSWLRLCGSGAPRSLYVDEQRRAWDSHVGLQKISHLRVASRLVGLAVCNTGFIVVRERIPPIRWQRPGTPSNATVSVRTKRYSSRSRNPPMRSTAWRCGCVQGRCSEA